MSVILIQGARFTLKVVALKVLIELKVVSIVESLKTTGTQDLTEIVRRNL